MRKIVMFFGAGTLVFLSACTSYGIARLPSNKTLFISTAPEEPFIVKGDLSYPYQPLGFVEVSSIECAPCAGDMAGVYKTLEKKLNKELVQKAQREMGADAVIDLKWSASSSFSGAVQQTAGCPYAALMLPGAYVMNLNVVNLKGLAVKKK
ncbi:hypothetical protein KJ633_04265 [bacterium]|nr:hypothetical protein [bacterium]MBU3955654.1 hypothetical protein [bacterium]MBU4134667.1 hypothetical protein [bacterium]